MLVLSALLPHTHFAFHQTLSVNKYLTFEQVLKALEYYESKTGMKEWYRGSASEAER